MSPQRALGLGRAGSAPRMEHHEVPGLGRVHLCPRHGAVVAKIPCGCPPGLPDGCDAIRITVCACSPTPPCAACADGNPRSTTEGDGR